MKPVEICLFHFHMPNGSPGNRRFNYGKWPFQAGTRPNTSFLGHRMGEMEAFTQFYNFQNFQKFSQKGLDTPKHPQNPQMKN